ncbi:MAG TPA: WYL domain-containing protein [Longimicrobiales bacterium]
MSDNITKTQRWLDLIAFLVGRRVPASVDDVMEAVPAYARNWRGGDDTARAAARRMFERDKDELRGLGIPIQTVSYSISYGLERFDGYRIARRDFYLPYLKLVAGSTEGGGAVGGAGEVEIAEAEAGAALEALRHIGELPSFPLAAEARSAFRKLAFDLDPTAFTGAPVLFVDRPGAEELADRVRVLSDALLARKRVRFRYRGIYRDAVTERDVAGYGLLFQHGHWYLIGHDAARDDIRVFRAGRMEEVVPNRAKPGTPDYEIPAGFRLDDYVNREAWELGGEDEAPVHAEVLFHFPASLLAERNGRGTLVEQRPDGAQVRAFEVAQVNPFLRWLSSHEGEAEVLAPPELAVELKELARAIAAVHATDAGGTARRGAGAAGRAAETPPSAAADAARRTTNRRHRTGGDDA